MKSLGELFFPVRRGYTSSSIVGSCAPEGTFRFESFERTGAGLETSADSMDTAAAKLEVDIFGSMV